MVKKILSKAEANTDQNVSVQQHQPQQYQQQQQQQHQQHPHLYSATGQQPQQQLYSTQQQSSLPQSFNYELPPFDQQLPQHQEGPASYICSDPQQHIMSASDQQQVPQQRQPQHQLHQQQQPHHQLQPQHHQQQHQHHPQQEQLLPQAEQQKQQQIHLQSFQQENIQSSTLYNPSICSAPTPVQVSAHQPDYQTMTCSQAMGGGGSVSISPAKMDHGLAFRDEPGVFNSLTAFPNLELPNGKRQRLDPPVAAYPDRTRFDRGYHFRVMIPGTGPKLLVNEDEDGEARRINTEMCHMITLELTHTPEPSGACFRFLLVYSKDAEAANAVVPCANHRRVEHPEHMLEVKAGDREANIEWQVDPHPSVLVTPTNQAPGRFTCQLAFLCRNSCLTRRELTLLCQLEVGRHNIVVGREPFKVKVSACPRRDAGAPTRRCTMNTSNSNGLPALSSSLSGPYPQPQIPAPDQERMPATSDIMRETMQEAERQGKRTAWLVFLDTYFREKLPEQHREASEMFHQMTKSNDI